MIGSMISFNEELNKNVPFYHRIWAYPSFWLGVVIILSLIFCGIFISPFSRFMENAERGSKVWCDIVIGWPLLFILSLPAMLSMFFISRIGVLNKYYLEKEKYNDKKYS